MSTAAGMPALHASISPNPNAPAGNPNVGPGMQETPARGSVYRVQTKRFWSEDWATDPSLIPIGATDSMASVGVGRLDLERHFGLIKDDFETQIVQRDPLQLGRHWVRVQRLADGRARTIWVGRIADEPVEVDPLDSPAGPGGAGNDPRGIQRWIAFTAARVLQDIEIPHTFWVSMLDGVQYPLGRIDSFNRRGPSGLIIGNMANPPVGTFSFGGELRWNRLQMIEYLRFYHIQQALGPDWQLAGQTDTVALLADVVRMAPGDKVSDVLSRILSPAIGLDYRVVPVLEVIGDDEEDDEVTAFSIDVRVLPAEQVTIAYEDQVFTWRNDHRIPRFDLTEPQLSAADTMIAQRHVYDEVHVVGQPIVWCFTLWGSSAIIPPGTPIPIQFVRGWPEALGAAYENGTGTPSDSAEKHDKARKADIYRDVSAKGIVDRNQPIPFPVMMYNGEFETIDTPQQQNLERMTLDWLPFQQNADYTVIPPQGQRRDYDLRPMFVAVDVTAGTAAAEWSMVDRLEEDAAGVSPTPRDFGFRVSFEPNHLFGWPFGGTPAPTQTEPKFSPDYALATIAVTTDSRLRMAQTLPIAEQTGENRIKVVTLPDLAVYAVSPGTVIDISEDGNLITTPQSVAMITRDDRPFIAAALAGAVARFQQERRRLVCASNVLEMWGELLGSVIETTWQGGFVEDLNATVTTIEWDFTTRRTTFKTGQATGAAP